MDRLSWLIAGRVEVVLKAKKRFRTMYSRSLFDQTRKIYFSVKLGNPKLYVDTINQLVGMNVDLK